MTARECWNCGRPAEADFCVDCEHGLVASETSPNGAAATPSSTPSSPRPRVTPSPVLSSYREDGVDHPVPDPVLEPHSWLPVSLVEHAASPPEPPDVIGLFYVGLNHIVTGESEALKTWLALVAAVSELDAGRGVLWVDGDDVGAGALLERLRLFGATDDAIDRLFAYVRPDGPLTADVTPDVVAAMVERSCRLVVCDGFNPLLTLHMLDPNSGTDVELFYRLLDPLRRLPAAVVITDNVVKNREARGAWAIGSERKKSKAEVHLGMKSLLTLERGGKGKAKIDVHKDRPGHLQRPSVGVFVIETDSDVCSWRIEPDESRDDEGKFRPTHLMERVSRHLELYPTEPQSRTSIEEAVQGNTKALRTAIDRLVEEGHATEFQGARGARLVRLEQAFREETP